MRRLYQQWLDVYDGLYGVSNRVETKWQNIKVILEGAEKATSGKGNSLSGSIRKEQDEETEKVYYKD